MTTLSLFSGPVHDLLAVSPGSTPLQSTVAQHDGGGAVLLLVLGVALLGVLRATVRAVLAVVRPLLAMVRMLLLVGAVVTMTSVGMLSRPSDSSPGPAVQPTRSAPAKAKPVPHPAPRRTSTHPAPTSRARARPAPTEIGTG